MTRVRVILDTSDFDVHQHGSIWHGGVSVLARWTLSCQGSPQLLRRAYHLIEACLKLFLCTSTPANTHLQRYQDTLVATDSWEPRFLVPLGPLFLSIQAVDCKKNPSQQLVLQCPKRNSTYITYTHTGFTCGALEAKSSQYKVTQRKNRHRGVYECEGGFGMI